MDAKSLLDAYALGSLRLSNRVVMAPMSRGRSDLEGLATPRMATYFAQRASAGLIITDGIWPSLPGKSNEYTPGLVTDQHVASWRAVTAAVHANGGRIFAQLMHGGRVGHAQVGGVQPVAPSAIPARGRVHTANGPLPLPTPRALTTSQVRQEAGVYAAAARRAVDAGFDGVEIHGANGYLISQFLSTSANQRTDRYGGSITGRIRFAVEATAATVDAVGKDRVGIRLSPGAGLWDTIETDVPDLYQALLAELAGLDIAYVHMTASTDDATLQGFRRSWPNAFMVNPVHPASSTPAGVAEARHWLGQGADLISFARAFIANPDLVERLRMGLPLASGDPATYYSGADRGYITYAPYPHQRRDLAG